MNITKPAVVLLLGVRAGCASETDRDTDLPTATEGQVDLARHAGRWRELARFPNSFEEGCANVTVDYTLREDGAVAVVNTCERDGETTIAEGVAAAETAANDRLSVDFVAWAPFTSRDDWRLDVTDDHRIAVIGNPAGSSGWILARSPEISAEDRAEAEAEAVLTQIAYGPSRLHVTIQSGG